MDERFNQLHSQINRLAISAQRTITCSKLTTEGLEQGVKYVPS